MAPFYPLSSKQRGRWVLRKTAADTRVPLNWASTKCRQWRLSVRGLPCSPKSPRRQISASPIEMRKLRPTEVSEQEWPFSIGITWCVHTTPCEPQGDSESWGPYPAGHCSGSRWSRWWARGTGHGAVIILSPLKDTNDAEATCPASRSGILTSLGPQTRRGESGAKRVDKPTVMDPPLSLIPLLEAVARAGQLQGQGRGARVILL